MLLRPALRAATGLVAAVLVAGCAGGAAGAAGEPAVAGTLQIAAGFYPLQYAAEQVGGDLVAVTNLTAAGVEPHDLELAPSDVVTVTEADLVVYLSGFQPAVDEAVATHAADRGFDVADAARLTSHVSGDEDGDPDPHFWLDPTRLADVGVALADRLAAVDPEHADVFAANARALGTDLAALDAEVAKGLATCQSRLLVVSHAAFGYLAERYDLRQRPIRGLSPDGEPPAGQLAQLADFVRAEQVRTVYFETLVSSDVAATIAAEAGVRTDVLDPIEGVSDDSRAPDYPGLMRANLASLRTGQPCP